MTKNEDEELYFARVQAEQREKLRTQLEAQAKELAERQRIAATTQTTVEVAERIRALGFDGETAKVFDLLPLVWVAWADGKVQRDERAAILRVLQLRGIAPGTEAFAFTEALLEQRPSGIWLEQALGVLKELLHGEQAGTVLDLCIAVAAVSGGTLGFGKKIDDQERELLRHLAQALGDQAHLAQLTS
jgi:tellurite resistance protein